MSLLGTAIHGGGTNDFLTENGFFMSLLGGQMTKAKKRVNHDSALRLPAYFSAIRVISEDIGKTPLPLYTGDRQHNKRSKAVENPLYNLIRYRPNPDMSSQLFRELLVQWAFGWGGGVAEIQWNNNRTQPVNFWPIHPSRVTIERNDADEKIYKVHNDRGKPTTLAAQDVLHIRGFGDSENGYSLAAYIAETIGLGLAASEFGASFLGNAMRPSGYLASEVPIEEAEANELRRVWREAYSGSGEVGKTPVLSGAIKWNNITVRPDEAQYIETVKHNLEDIARAVRLHPSKIGDISSRQANLEHAAIEHVGDGLMPWALRIEDEINYKVFGNDPTIFVEHNFDALLRADVKTRNEVYNMQFRNGRTSVDEIRARENLNPLPDNQGSEYYVTADLVPLSMLEELATRPRDNRSRVNDDSGQRREASDTTQIIASATDNNLDALAVWRPTMESIVKRSMAKEAVATRKAVKKNGYQTKGLSSWAEDFYAKQQQEYIANLTPVCEGYCMTAGVQFDETKLFVAVDTYCTTAQRSTMTLDGVEALDGFTDSDAWAPGFVDDLIATLEN